MNKPKVQPMPLMLVLFKIAQMPRNGYVFLRFRREIINGKTINSKHIMCWYHFVCWVFYYSTVGLTEYRTRHWNGDTDIDMLLRRTQVLIEDETFEITRISDYDGRYRHDCYYCNGRTKRGRGRAMCGEVPYINGP